MKIDQKEENKKIYAKVKAELKEMRQAAPYEEHLDRAEKKIALIWSLRPHHLWWKTATKFLQFRVFCYKELHNLQAHLRDAKGETTNMKIKQNLERASEICTVLFAEFGKDFRIAGRKPNNKESKIILLNLLELLNKKIPEIEAIIENAKNQEARSYR